MKKLYLKIISVITATTLLISGFTCVNSTYTVYADEITADFDIDPELWKALTEANTFKYDDDNDGIVTKEEFADSYGMQIDCEGYDIKDWSGLKYGTNWKFVAIKNCDAGDFSVLSEMPALYELCFTDCKDFTKLTGLDSIDKLTKITVDSNNIVDLNAFKSHPDLVELSVTAPEITGYDAIDEIKNLDALSLSADTCNEIENYPDKMFIDRLSISFKDFNDEKMNAFIDKHTRINNLTVNNSNISSLEWIHDLKYLYYLDIRDNQCRDISTLLEHKNLHSMTLYLDRNPWAPDTEDILAKTLLELEDEYTLATGDYIYLKHMTSPYWYCDIVGNLEFSISDESIANIRDGYSQVRAYSPGNVLLKVSNGKDINLEYRINVTGSPIETNTPDPGETPSAEPPAWVGVTVGDVNFDKMINAEDALLALKHAAKIITLSNSDIWAADVDISYGVDATDALNILKYAAHIIPSFEEVVVGTYPPVEPLPTESIEPTKMPTDYDNSFEITVETTEKKTFTAEDFPSIALTEVITASMLKTDHGYTYELLLYLDDTNCSEEILEASMTSAAEYEGVIDVDYNSYCAHDSVIELNYTEYELKVGKSISLYIEDYRPYNSSTHTYCTIVKLSEASINGSAITEDSFAPYGFSKCIEGNKYTAQGFLVASRNPAININDELTYVLDPNTRSATVKKVHELSQIPEVETVAILWETYPTGNRSTEYWDISNEEIASITLSGGNPITENSSITKLDQTATITALAPGEVIVSVTKQGWGNQEGTGICKIKIVE